MVDTTRFRTVMGTLVVALVTAAGLGAQQQNSLLAGLSVNGTGLVQPNGTILATSSAVIPPPAGSAPIYHHRAAPQTALRLAVQGLVGRPIILAAGVPAVTPISIFSGVVELAPASAQILLNGLSPSNFLDLSAYVGADGDWSIDLPGGVGLGTPTVTFQALIFDPTAPPPFYRTSASITLQIEGSIDTLMRNVIDGVDQVVDNPLLLPSCCASTFLFGGLDRSQFVALEVVEHLLEPFRFLYEGIGPESSTAPALPTGSPTTGATASLYVQAIEDLGTSTCPPGPRRGRNRSHGLFVREQNGAWKFNGDQRPADIELELSFSQGMSNPQGLDVVLRAYVEDSLGSRGGIAGVGMTGPQLSGYDTMTGNSTSAASGSVALVSFNGGGGPSEWEIEINLAVAAAGSSRLPRVVDGVSPADSYDVTITWNDGTVSGPYSIPLRAAFDVAANPSAVLAAIPGSGMVTTTLNMGGTPNATIDFTFGIGTLTGTGLAGGMDILITQSTPGGGLEVDVESLDLPATPSTPTLTLCAPGFVTGAPTGRFVSQSDYYSNRYVSFGPINL